jgi:hypothetical protein
MENKVYTQDELRRENILTDEYALNLEPGEFIARLDLKAETPRRNNCLRLFFTFEDGRKVMSTAHWWQRYLGFIETPADTQKLIVEVAHLGTAFNLFTMRAAQAEQIDTEEYRRVTDAVWEAYHDIRHAYLPNDERRN